MGRRNKFTMRQFVAMYRACAATFGRKPTIAQMANHMGGVSTRTAQRYMNKLKASDHVRLSRRGTLEWLQQEVFRLRVRLEHLDAAIWRKLKEAK